MMLHVSTSPNDQYHISISDLYYILIKLINKIKFKIKKQNQIMKGDLYFLNLETVGVELSSSLAKQFECCDILSL